MSDVRCAVGAVYDRAFSSLGCESCAVIDRAYSGGKMPPLRGPQVSSMNGFMTQAGRVRASGDAVS